jgi:chromosome segregation ATPase
VNSDAQFVKQVVKLEGMCQETSAQHQRTDTDVFGALSELVEGMEATVQGTEAVMGLVVTGANVKEMSVSCLQRDVARLAAALASAEEDACSLETRLSETEDRCSDLSKMLREANGDMTKMTARLESAEHEVAGMKETLETAALGEKTAREAMLKMEGVIAENLSEIESSRATLEALREKESDVAAMRERVEVAEGESKRLSAALKVMRQNEDKFGPIVVTIKEKLASAETEVMHLTVGHFTS